MPTTQSTPVDFLPTHFDPHPDELVAILLLKECGRDHFPGIEKAQVVFYDSGAETPDKSPAEEWIKRGHLPIGIWASPFDEHPNKDKTRKKGDCAATLVAKHLGIFGERWLTKLLDAVVNEDENAGSDILAITSIAKKMWALDPQGTMDWVMKGLKTILDAERHIWGPSKRWFHTSANDELITGADGHPIRIATIISGDRFMSRYALHTEGGNCQVLIQKHPQRGGVQIFTKQGEGLNFIEVVRLIRQNERLANGLSATLDRTILDREGTVEGAECWFFHEKGQMLLNQSNTAPGKPRTLLLLSVVVELVKLGLRTPFDRTN